MSPIVLVTGANKGIGREIATQLARDHGYHVLVAARKLPDAQSLVSELQGDGYPAEAVQLDLESDESIAACVQHIEQQHGRLDVLVNNAGVLLDAWEPGISKLPVRELFTRTFSTNVAGTAALTEALSPLLRKASPSPPRVVFVSSHLGSSTIGTDRTFMFYNADLHAYMASKAAINRLALVYARQFEDVGGIVNIGAPGFVKTGLTNNHEAGVTPAEGARHLVELATGTKDTPSFSFTDSNGTIPW